MSRRIAWRVAAAAVAIIATLAVAARNSNGKPDMQAQMEAHVERIIAPAMSELVPKDGPGGVAVAVRMAGRTLYFNQGLTDQSTRQPITSDSLFNLASLRKPFEAVLVAQGVMRGELSLDDPVNKYVGELQGDYIRQVTIGELAAHTSGLLLPTDHPPWPDTAYTLGEFLAMLNAFKPEDPGVAPGKQRIYTHAGYVLLQLALERRYGRPISALIEEHILRPLGMNSTLVPERGPDNHAVMGAEFLRRAVQGYSVDGMPIGGPANQQSYFDFPGTGQMFSTARDLALFVVAALNEGAGDPELLKALQLTQRLAFRIDDNNAQAMAWEITNWGGVPVTDKPGGLNNASAYMGLVPEHRLGLVILSNRGDVYPFELARRSILPALARL
jgi:beta-lactamase class C